MNLPKEFYRTATTAINPRKRPDPIRNPGHPDTGFNFDIVPPNVTDTSWFYDPIKLFYAYFGTLPSSLHMEGMDPNKVVEYVEDLLADRMSHRLSKYNFHHQKGCYSVEYMLYMIDGKYLLYLYRDNLAVYYSDDDTELATEFFESLKACRTRARKQPRISLLAVKQDRIGTTEINLPPARINLTTHYNDDLRETHDKMLAELRKKNNSGLFLLHGLPGSGKSTYLRYIMHRTGKQVIFLSPNMLTALEGPMFTSFLVDHANCIFIVEDAEELLVARDQGGKSGIALLLNLTDGLLGEGLGIQVVATFNTDIRRIDKALTRKGRLKAAYRFQALEPAKAAALMQSLGHDAGKANPEGMTLAEIYNHGVDDAPDSGQEVRIGFRS